MNKSIKKGYNNRIEYTLNGQLHRVDGPAIEYISGTKVWYLNGQLHREDGPAIECADGYKKWWINGKKLTEKKFNRTIKFSSVVLRNII